jgi:hypothetical protein
MMRWVLAIVCLPFLPISAALLVVTFRSITHMDILLLQQCTYQPLALLYKGVTITSMDRAFYFQFSVVQQSVGISTVPPQRYDWEIQSRAVQDLGGSWRVNPGTFYFRYYPLRRPAPDVTRVFIAPQWTLIVLTGLPPMAWIIYNRRYLRGRWRAVRGLCEMCGYDLRATPDRCPECGTVPSKKEVVSS